VAQIRVGDQVEILAGRREGKFGTITEVSPRTLIIAVDGLPYEVSEPVMNVKVVVTATRANDIYNAGLLKAACSTQDGTRLTGEKKQKFNDYLVKNKLICPSSPFSCTGECGIDHKKVQQVRTKQRKANHESLAV